MFDDSTLHWLTFFSAAFLLNLSPGPDMAYILGQSASRGLRRHPRIGQWLDRGQGVMTEACRALRDFAFDSLALTRLRAMHLLRNPASGRVLRKSGFVRRGQEQRALKGGRKQ